jgi:Zn-dependent peptidase ImmA (M78 family)
MAYNIPLRVRNLINKVGSTDPYDIADYLGIKIKTVDTPSYVNGFWQQILTHKFIFINQNLCEWQRKAVIGHELGHIILHPEYSYFCMNRRTYYCSQRHENEADYFSIELCSYSMDIEANFIELFLKDGWK